jgi:hypothetical protein
LSAATAVYVASTGTLGTLVNAGTVMGDVVNQSAGNLTIVGGSASNGVFTGQSGAQGMISSANGDVVLASAGSCWTIASRSPATRWSTPVHRCSWIARST